MINIDHFRYYRFELEYDDYILKENSGQVVYFTIILPLQLFWPLEVTVK